MNAEPGTDRSSCDAQVTPTRDDYVQALQSMHTYIDISVDDLMTLSSRAARFAEQRQTGSLPVDAIMAHPVHVVREHTLMSEAAELLVTHRISGLPVVDDDDRLIGIVTEADFLRSLGVPSSHPTHNLWQTLGMWVDHLNESAGGQGPNDPVSAHMVRDVITVSDHGHLHNVMALMQEHKVKRLVVTDEQKQVRGMITRSDIVRLFFQRYTPQHRRSDTDDPPQE